MKKNTSNDKSRRWHQKNGFVHAALTHHLTREELEYMISTLDRGRVVYPARHGTAVLTGYELDHFKVDLTATQKGKRGERWEDEDIISFMHKGQRWFELKP